MSSNGKKTQKSWDYQRSVKGCLLFLTLMALGDSYRVMPFKYGFISIIAVMQSLLEEINSMESM